MSLNPSYLAAPTSEIFWCYEVAIVPGKLEDFCAVARDIMAMSGKESGTVDFEWCLNPDNTVCHIFERYRDSEALFTHAESFGRLYAERFMEACRPTRFDIYGSPSDAAKAVLAQYKPTYFSKITGSSR